MKGVCVWAVNPCLTAAQLAALRPQLRRRAGRPAVLQLPAERRAVASFAVATTVAATALAATSIPATSCSATATLYAPTFPASKPGVSRWCIPADAAAAPAAAAAAAAALICPFPFRKILCTWCSCCAATAQPFSLAANTGRCLTTTITGAAGSQRRPAAASPGQRLSEPDGPGCAERGGVQRPLPRLGCGGTDRHERCVRCVHRWACAVTTACASRPLNQRLLRWIDWVGARAALQHNSFNSCWLLMA